MPLCQTCGRDMNSRHLDRPVSKPPEKKLKPPPKYRSRTYQPLPNKRGYIRLLNVRGSPPANPLVECELIIKAFDKSKESDGQKNKIDPPYEALSWCWGPPAKVRTYINIRKDGKIYAKYVSPELVAALKALRYPKQDRYIWVDAVCIDQDNDEEKNHQVEMMSEIYGRAGRVCVWLGEGDDSSRLALRFIKKEVLQLQNFDELCESAQASEKWGALLDLMQRPWFSRRWVVQEIALARRAVVYCGGDMLSWKKFAVAVELFVEVETATHRLSEVMKKDPKFYHVPGWFEYVSALGASLLVEATGKLFRDYKPNDLDTLSDSEPDSDGDGDSDDDSDDDTDAESDTGSSSDSDIEPIDELTINNAEPPVVQPLLSLEYLVSSLSIFQATVPHDTIYALLAIAKDTTPSASDADTQNLMDQTKDVLEVFTEKKAYKVEYGQPFVDVCKDFVQFCIETNSDQTRALDVICRPWAPEPNKAKHRLPPPPKNDKEGIMSKIVNGTIMNGKLDTEDHKSPPEGSNEGSNETSIPPETPPLRNKPRDNMPMPSWIPKLSGAAYAMYSQAGVHELKMGRKNADTLVGLPPSFSSLERNYNAAQTKKLDRKALKFRRRNAMKHYSMYVKGFILDTVVEVLPSSQGGAIPREWAKAAGWRHAPDDDPPDDFWRTLVADRGRDGRNPPVYYSRACKESFFKGGLQSGRVDTTDLINNERCSVVAQFCRRVQAVIWNRSLIKTRETKRLGLANQKALTGDLVCILYGCSAPVILRRMEKNEKAGEIDSEVDEDFQHWRLEIKSRILRYFRRAKKFREKRNIEMEEYEKWDKRMREEWEKDTEWLKLKQLRLQETATNNQRFSDAPVTYTMDITTETEIRKSEQIDAKTNSVTSQPESEGSVLPSDVPLPGDDTSLSPNSINSDETDSALDTKPFPNLDESEHQGAPPVPIDTKVVETKKNEADKRRREEELKQKILEEVAEQRRKDKDYKAWKAWKRAEAKRAAEELEADRQKEEERKILERKEALRNQVKRKKPKGKDRREERQSEPEAAKPEENSKEISTQGAVKAWDEPRVNWRKFELRLQYGRRWKHIVQTRKGSTRKFGEDFFILRRDKKREPLIKAKMASIPASAPKTDPLVQQKGTGSNGCPSSNEERQRTLTSEAASTLREKGVVPSAVENRPALPDPIIGPKEKSRSKTLPNLPRTQVSNGHNGISTPDNSLESQPSLGEVDAAKTKGHESSESDQQQLNGASDRLLPVCARGKKANIRELSDAYLKPMREKIRDRYFEKNEDKELAAEERKLGRPLHDGEKEKLQKMVEDHNKRAVDNKVYYEFLGECYIHGMMDGEAMAYQNNPGGNEKPIPARIFELR